MQAINDRIKQLDFQDCKVRVSNVDSQESFKNIVVQVIGEISNKAAAHRKFVQTFVLAEQPKGYFVLNDIFRYILEDEEEEMENGEAAEEAQPTQTLEPEPEPTTSTSSTDSVQQEHDAEQVDRKLEEEEVLHQSASDLDLPTDATPADGPTPTEAVDVAEDAPAAVTTVKEADEVAGAPEQAAETATIEDDTKPEKPRDPDPTPIASPSKLAKADPVESAASATPAAPPKPAAPKTWANLVAANRIPASSVPNGASSNNSITTPTLQPKAAPSSTNRSATPPTSSTEDAPTKTQQNGNSGWQMAGSDNSKKQGRQHSQSASGGQENVLGYVKNVTDKVDASILKTTLAQYGKLVYFDVSRPKVCDTGPRPWNRVLIFQQNCAFVEFADAAAYNAAVIANPHSIGGEQIYVEERRPRANAYGGNFAGRGGMRGGRGGNESRPGSSQGRGGRGGYRVRGRGAPQAA